MDPDANLAEQLELCKWLEENSATHKEKDWSGEILEYPNEDYEHKVSRLTELVFALHGWIGSGGFLPKVWQRQD